MATVDLTYDQILGTVKQLPANDLSRLLTALCNPAVNGQFAAARTTVEAVAAANIMVNQQ